MLVEDNVFFADPTTFNDPLDTKPTLEIDLPSEVLEKVLTQLIEQRTRAEMKAAARTIQFNGPKTLDHIARRSRMSASRVIADIRYEANNRYYDVKDPEQLLLGDYVEIELLRRYDRGVFSLAERANCPLMWSHYGDQHHGICLGYSVPDDVAENVHKMKYGGSRSVKASAVAAMLACDDDNAALREVVDEAVLLKKAKPWAYEREWRLLGSRGEQGSPLELEEVIFGMRCSSAVVFAVVKALEGRDRPVKFYEIRGKRGLFLLDKRVLHTEEMLSTLPIRRRGTYEMFSDLGDLDDA